MPRRSIVCVAAAGLTLLIAACSTPATGPAERRAPTAKSSAERESGACAMTDQIADIPDVACDSTGNGATDRRVSGYLVAAGHK